ncbi:MAG: GxxExxY protein [Gammaproteobacteria bacterium]|nr:GxxExxY protein [Gammaproteobacteria bacterium]
MNSVNKKLVDCDEAIIDRVIAAAITVHKALGPGLFESIYEQALVFELKGLGFSVSQQKEIAVQYREQDLGIGFRADIIVNDCLLLELKSVERLNEKHAAQIIAYLKLLNLKRGFLLNFNESLMKKGIKRISI